MNVINDEGGTKKPSDFYILITGDSKARPDRFLGTWGPTGTTITLLGSEPRMFRVESRLNTAETVGYDISYSGDCTFTPSSIVNSYPQRNLICTITAKSIKVVTNVINDSDNDRPKKPSDFITSIEGRFEKILILYYLSYHQSSEDQSYRLS